MVGKTLEEASKMAKESEVELVIEKEEEELDKQNTIVKEQVPKAGIIIKKGSKVYVKWGKGTLLFLSHCTFTTHQLWYLCLIDMKDRLK